MTANITKEEIKKMTIKEMMKRVNIREDKIIKIIDEWGNTLTKEDLCVTPNHKEVIIYTWGD